MKKYSKLWILLASAGLASLAGCRSFETIQSKIIPEEYLAYSPNDSYTSIDDAISEASRYNAEDKKGRNLSNLIVPKLNEIRMNILHGNNEYVQKWVQDLEKTLDSSSHPLALLVRNQMKDLSYVVIYEVDKKTNAIKFKGKSSPTGAAAAGAGTAAGVGSVGYFASAGPVLSTSAATGVALGIVVGIVGGVPVALQVIELPYTISKSILGTGEDISPSWSWPKSFLYVGRNRKTIIRKIRYYPSSGKEIIEDEFEK